jgi:hypothetical protein
MNASMATLLDSAIPIVLGILVCIVGFSDRTAGERRWRALRRVRALGPLLLLFGALSLASRLLANRLDELSGLASALNERLGVPAMIDAETRLERVDAHGDAELTYVLTLVNQSSSSGELSELVSHLEAMLDATSCQNEGWLKFLESGVSIRMRYMSSDGQEVLSKVVRPADCGL